MWFSFGSSVLRILQGWLRGLALNHFTRLIWGVKPHKVAAKEVQRERHLRKTINSVVRPSIIHAGP